MQGTGKPVTIVGGGIVGLSCGLALQELGQHVTLLDPNDPGQGTSYGNAGTISPWSIVPQAMPGLWKDLPGILLKPDGPASVSLRHGVRYLPWLWRFLRAGRLAEVQRISDAMFTLTQPSVDLYRHFLRGTGQEALVQDSFYVHAVRDASKATLNSLGNQLRLAKGADLEVIDAAALQALEPALSPAFQAAVLIKGQGRATNPGGIGQAFAAKFQREGGQIIRTKVRALEQLDAYTGWSLYCDDQTYQAQTVVIAAGAWSASLLKTLGIRVPLAAERGYHLSYKHSGVHITHSIMDVESHIIANGMDMGLRFAGIADFAGLETPPNPRHYATLRRKAQAMFPDLNTSEESQWMGVRPSFPDSLPAIGPVPEHPGLFVAFGHSHYGLMMAPQTGRLTAMLVTGQRPNQDLSPFALNRFR